MREKIVKELVNLIYLEESKLFNSTLGGVIYCMSVFFLLGLRRDHRVNTYGVCCYGCRRTGTIESMVDG